MNNPTRRRFLATTGAGAAAVGAAAIVPTVLAGSSHKAQHTAPAAGAVAGAKTAQAAPSAADPAAAPQVPSDASGSLLVWVANVRDDAVTLMVGEQDVIVHDQDLVARLASAAF